MELEQRIYNGDRAKEVLDNEAYTAAMAAIKTEVTEQWQNSPARDQEGREKLWLMLKLADKLEAALRTTMETGKLAQLDLLHKQSLAQRAKAAIGLD